MIEKRYFIFILISLFIITGCKTENTEKITVSIASGSIGSDFSVLEEQLAVFERLNPDINIDFLETPETDTGRYKRYVDWLKDKNSGVDVYVTDIVWTTEFAQNGWILPLNDYIEGTIDMSDFLDSTVKANTWKGNIVAFPWFTDAGVLYYRKDLLDKYGFSPPRTWDELKIIAKEIVKNEIKEHPHMVGFVFQADKYEGLVANYLEYVWSYGGDVISDSNRVILNSPQSVKGLTTYCDMLTISSKGITAFQEEDGRNYFQSGNSVFMRNWPYAYTLLNSEMSAVKGKFAIAPLPAGKEGYKSVSALGGWNLVISSGCKHQKEAFRLIEFLTGKEQQCFKAIKLGQNPTRKSCYYDEDIIKVNSSISYLFDIVKLARPRPVHPEYSRISRIIQMEVHYALEGKVKPDIATSRMAQSIEKIVSEQGF
ncbi:MAG: ABC transporter substrate-binding protein [Candidatus Eremiobacterota bacterium]